MCVGPSVFCFGVVVVACCCVFVFAVGTGRKGWKEKKRRCVIDRTVNCSLHLISRSNR